MRTKPKELPPSERQKAPPRKREPERPCEWCGEKTRRASGYCSYDCYEGPALVREAVERDRD